MPYDNLQELLRGSSSARSYFLSLPVQMQVSLHEHGGFIHTASELRRRSELIHDYEHRCQISESKIDGGFCGRG